MMSITTLAILLISIIAKKERKNDQKIVSKPVGVFLIIREVIFGE